MLASVDTVKNLLSAKKTLFLAGDEKLLKQVPRGNWIGGTIPYFMADEGGTVTAEKLFVTEAPDFVRTTTVKCYDEKNLENIPSDAPENGFSVIIIPATSGAHSSYARNAPNYPDIFFRPIIGWISGVHLSDLGKITPKVWNGVTGEVCDQKAVVMHCELPAGKVADIGIINLFKPGTGDVVTFDAEGFSVDGCLVNGKPVNFAEYLTSKKIDTRLPLVADYSGTMVNVSFQSVDAAKKTVALYAPVFRGVEYRIAAPVTDYVKEFTSQVAGKSINPVFSCNCILNFLYSELEGKHTGAITGPITFGEVAYQLLNQTLTYLEVRDV